MRALLILASLAAVTAVKGAAAAAPARAASTLRVDDSGQLHFRSVSATAIVDEGTIKGSMPGRGRVVFVYDGSPSVTARFTIQTSDGAIDGRAHCRLSNPTSPTPSFHGSLAIVGGSGRYAHARGSGNLYGVFHRRGYAISMQALGTLRY